MDSKNLIYLCVNQHLRNEYEIQIKEEDFDTFPESRFGQKVLLEIAEWLRGR